MSTPQVRPSIYSDASEIARVHKEAYSSRHFMSLMPRSLLTKYYQLFYVQGVEILVSYQKNENGVDEILGFSVFGQDIPKIIAFFKKQFFSEIVITGILHPWISFKKVLERIKSLVSEHNSHNPADHLLLSIAAIKNKHSIGSDLMDEMLLVAKTEGFEALGLYVNTDNLRAINLYFRSGFVIKSMTSGQFYMELTLDPEIEGRNQADSN